MRPHDELVRRPTTAGNRPVDDVGPLGFAAEVSEGAHNVVG
jgi:hypothetical protein